MLRKLIAAAALASAAVLILPTFTTSSFGQGGTLGAGAARTGTGPGTNAGDPNLTNKTGPGANPVSGTANNQAMKPIRKRHVARHHSRRTRSTVGSSGSSRTGAPGAGTVQGPVTQPGR